METRGSSGGEDEEEMASSIWKDVREDVFQGEIELAVDDDDDDDNEKDEPSKKISINSSIFMDDEEEDETDEFLQGHPPASTDVELSNNNNPPPLEEKRQKEGRKQKVSTRPFASEDDIEFNYVIHVPVKKETEFTTYTKRRKGRLCYKCLGCPYFETTELKKIKDHINKHRPRPASVASDNVDSGQGEASVFISGDIFEDANEGEKYDLKMEVENEIDQIQIKTEIPSTTKTSKSPEDVRKGRKQKLLPVASPDIQLIPPPVMKEIPRYTTFRNGKHTYYQCCECPAFHSTWRLMFDHKNLHRPVSSSITCPIPKCGWALDPKFFNRHVGVKHRRKEFSPLGQPIDNKSLGAGTSKYYRCAECEALFMGLYRLRAHWEVHDNGKGQICDECGWLCTSLSFHNWSWHPKEGGKHADMRLRTSERWIVTLKRDDLLQRGVGRSEALVPDPDSMD